jgi:hypothetical protein
LPLQVLRATLVAFGDRIHLVNRTIQLDADLQLSAVEIEDVVADRMLPPKLIVAKPAVAQP